MFEVYASHTEYFNPYFSPRLRCSNSTSTTIRLSASHARMRPWNVRFGCCRKMYHSVHRSYQTCRRGVWIDRQPSPSHESRHPGRVQPLPALPMKTPDDSKFINTHGAGRPRQTKHLLQPKGKTTHSSVRFRYYFYILLFNTAPSVYMKQCATGKYVC